MKNKNTYLFKNKGDNTFTDVTSSADVSCLESTSGVTTGDFNNDGLLDLFVNDHYHSNVLYKNNGNETFSDVATSMGITGGFGDYFGMSFGDFDNDGAIDLFVAGHFHIYKLYKNINCPGNFLTINLRGVESNLFGIDARVKIFSGEDIIYRNQNSGEGMFDFHSLPIEIGLDEYEIVDSLKIIWTNNNIQTLYNIDANQIITITENENVEIDDKYKFINESYKLEQNYPNPFNPVTKINYEIRIKNYEFAEILVSNVMGQQVWFSPILHHELHVSDFILFDGSKLNSGLYYYSLLIDGKKISTKSMLLR